MLRQCAGILTSHVAGAFTPFARRRVGWPTCRPRCGRSWAISWRWRRDSASSLRDAGCASRRRQCAVRSCRRSPACRETNEEARSTRRLLVQHNAWTHRATAEALAGRLQRSAWTHTDTLLRADNASRNDLIVVASQRKKTCKAPTSSRWRLGLNSGTLRAIAAPSFSCVAVRQLRQSLRHVYSKVLVRKALLRWCSCRSHGRRGVPSSRRWKQAHRAWARRSDTARCVAHAQCHRQGFNYANEHVGATRLAPACLAPTGAGYVVDHNRTCVGSGPADFAHAQSVLEKWGCAHAASFPVALALSAASATSSWAGRP